MDAGDDRLACQAETLPNLGSRIPIHYFTIFAILTRLTSDRYCRHEFFTCQINVQKIKGNLKIVLTFDLFSYRIFVLIKKGERNVTEEMGVSTHATTQIVTADGCRTA